MAHHAFPQKVVAINRPAMTTGAIGWPFLRIFSTSRIAFLRRSATGT
ncbi:MAG: hypothetical protein H7832_14180 [Magnetococcus sp. DMHC-6]